VKDTETVLVYLPLLPLTLCIPCEPFFLALPPQRCHPHVVFLSFIFPHDSTFILRHSMHLFSTSSTLRTQLSILAYFSRQTLPSREAPLQLRSFSVYFILHLIIYFSWFVLSSFPCANDNGLPPLGPNVFWSPYSRPLYSEYSIGTLTLRFYFLLSFALFRVLSCPIVPQFNACLHHWALSDNAQGCAWHAASARSVDCTSARKKHVGCDVTVES